MKKLKLKPKKCLICGKLIELKIRRDIERKKLCSKECRYKYLANKNSVPNPKKAHKKENHPFWKGGPVEKECLICKKKFFITRHKYNSGFGIYCSRRCMGKGHEGKEWVKRIELKCPVCGKVFRKLKSKLIEKRRPNKINVCSSKCASMIGLLSNKRKDTSIEKKIEILLKENNIGYEKQKRIDNITIPDFILNDKVIIYCDGTYWHSSKEIKERDERQNKYLINKGYKVLRLTEQDINNNIAKCLTQINGTI
jgi:very-short-patch-repair endonuclease